MYFWSEKKEGDTKKQCDAHVDLGGVFLEYFLMLGRANT